MTPKEFRRRRVPTAEVCTRHVRIDGLPNRPCDPSRQVMSNPPTFFFFPTPSLVRVFVDLPPKYSSLSVHLRRGVGERGLSLPALKVAPPRASPFEVLRAAWPQISAFVSPHYLRTERLSTSSCKCTLCSSSPRVIYGAFHFLSGRGGCTSTSPGPKMFTVSLPVKPSASCAGN